MTKLQQNRAHELRQEIIQLRISATEQFFRLGEILKEIRDEEYWKMGWESFDAYFSDPELGLKSSTVYHAIKMIETFPNREKLLGIPVSRLVMIAPHVTSDNREKLIEAAKGLSRSDLRHELLTHGLEPTKEEIIPIPKIYGCKTCKRVKGVRFDGLCHCGWTKEQIEYIGKLIDKIEYD